MSLSDNYTLIKGLFNQEESDTLFKGLKDNIPWQNELYSVSGEKIKIKRKMCYVSNQDTNYNYGNLILKGISWDTTRCYKTGSYIEPYPRLAKFLVKYRTNNSFNSVLLNYYENGKDKINWHSDKEEQLGDDPVIGCLSLGATRNFHLLEKSSGDRIAIPLESGDFLIMNKGCQKNCLHAILPEKEVVDGRISLTFRNVI